MVFGTKPMFFAPAPAISPPFSTDANPSAMEYEAHSMGFVADSMAEEA